MPFGERKVMAPDTELSLLTDMINMLLKLRTKSLYKPT